MSGFAFSHQFTQRWIDTPITIKQTIIHELDDIFTLLQPETDLDSFQFRVANLHDSVEALTQAEKLRLAKLQEQARLQAEKEEQEKQAKLIAERLEQERLAQEKLEKERLEQQRLAQEKLAQEQAEKQRLEQQAQEKAAQEQAFQTQLATAKKDITDNLQKQIDNYINESVTLMRKDLQAWLTIEVENQLKAQMASPTSTPTPATTNERKSNRR